MKKNMNASKLFEHPPVVVLAVSPYNCIRDLLPDDIILYLSSRDE